MIYAENSTIKVRRPTHNGEPEDVDMEEGDDNTPRQQDFRNKSPSLISLTDGEEPYITPVALQRTRRRKMRVPADDTDSAGDSEAERVSRKKMRTRKQLTGDSTSSGDKVMCQSDSDY